MESLQVVISRKALIEQTWRITPEGLRIEEPGAAPIEIGRAHITGFGLPAPGGAGGTSHVLVAYRGTRGSVERYAIPVLDGSVHGMTEARRCYDALCRAMPELDRGWGTVPGPVFHERLGISITGLAPVLMLVALAVFAALALLLALWARG